MTDPAALRATSDGEFHAVPKPVFRRLNKPAGELVFRVTTARAGGAGLQQVPPEALGRTEGFQSGPCRWPDQLSLPCPSLGPAEEQPGAGACRALGRSMCPARRRVRSSSVPRCLHRLSLRAVQSGSPRPQFNTHPVGGRGAPPPPGCWGPREALRGMAPASPEPAARRRRRGGPSGAPPGGPRSSRPRPVSGGRPSSGTPPGGGGRGGGGMAGVRRAR